MEKINIREILEWVLCIVIAIVLALVVRTFIGTPTAVQQQSMHPTLIEGERLILNKISIKLGNHPKRGDVITFEAPSSSIISATDVDINNPVAVYDYEPQGVFNKFKYYILEIEKKSYIKRVIAVPGEHIKIEDGKVYVNNEELEEPYLQSDVVTTNLQGQFTDLVVPEGHVFVMGDNRGQSTDSRRFGCVPYEKIESKVLMRFWPLNKFGGI